MYRMLIKIVFSILFLLIVKSGFAQSVDKALDLMSDGENNAAYKILSELSNQGDVVAQYNLGLMLKKGIGRDKDAEQATYWFTQAAQKGLVAAYQQIQPGAVKAAVGVHLEATLNAQEWVQVQKPGYYTLQLASSTNEKLIEKYYLENNLQGKGGYYRNRRQGENWYALVYGAYPSVSKANEAVASLPDDLKKWSPWVRKIKGIQRIMNH